MESLLSENELININIEPEANILSINVKVEMMGESLLSIFHDEGIFISTKSACSKKLNEPNRSLAVIGLTMDEMNRTFRISIGKKTEEKDIRELAKKIIEIIEKNKRG